MAAVAVRKKVVSIGHFSQIFFSPRLFFYFLDQINSTDSEKNRAEPNHSNHSTRYTAMVTEMLSCICMLN